MTERFVKIVLVSVSVLLAVTVFQTAYAQPKKNTAQVEKQQGKIKGQAAIQKELIFEEIQRYLGYETLPTRYLSIPYDVTMNANVDAYYVEIGFLMLMFIPLMLLIGFRKKPLIGFGVMFLTLFLFVISTANGILMKDKLVRIAINEQTLSKDLSNIDASKSSMDFVDYFMIHVYNITYQLYTPIENILLTFSGKKDYVTYPFLVFVLFPLLFGILYLFLKERSSLKQIMAYAVLLFAFLWMMFAAGIIWYGYLVMAVSFVFMAAFFSKKFEGPAKYIKYAFVGIVLIWLCLTLVLRISNIYNLDQSAGVHFFDAPIVKYQLGETDKKGKKFSEEDLIQNYFPGLNTALKGINRNGNDSYVYSIGTMFPYFVKKNNQRIFNDNLLALFQAVLDRYNSDKVEVVQVLKAFGFRYILINLKLHKIDKTPEKSVTQKYINFMNFIYQNPGMELIATDRLIMVDEKLSYGMFGDIKSEGSYAIFKIK